MKSYLKKIPTFNDLPERVKAQVAPQLRSGLSLAALALFAAAVLRSFLFEPFTIPSTSMVPTLLVGDYIFVSKPAYGYSRYSFPFSLPLFEGRIYAKKPKRGDVLVFRNPKKSHIDYVKRLMALPGDTVQMKKGLLYINDAPIKRQYLGTVHGSNFLGTRYDTYHHFQETLDNGVSYTTLEHNNRSAFDDTARIIVPDDHYFVMGDNRDDSSDSRDIINVGAIPEDHLVGKVSMIMFSYRNDEHVTLWNPWSWFVAFRQERFFRTLP